MTQTQPINKDFLLQAKLDNAKILYNLAKSVNFKEVSILSPQINLALIIIYLLHRQQLYAF